MRMTASWSGPNDPTEYKSVARRCAQSRAPLGSSTDRQTGTDQKPTLCKKPVSQFIVAPLSGVKALRNTSDARRPSRQALLPFRSLDPFRALREPDRRRRDEERPFPLRTKNCNKPKTTT